MIPPPSTLLATLSLLAWRLTPLKGEGSPLCQVLVNSTLQLCYKFEPIDLCCALGGRFQEVMDSQTVSGGLGLHSTGTANVSFRYTAKRNGDPGFLLSRSRGCSSSLECYFLEPLPMDRTDDGVVSVEVAFLPGNAEYKVASLDERQLEKWKSSPSGEEAKVLNESFIQFDIVGSDALIKLHPPVLGTAIPETMSSICVKVCSSSRAFQCNQTCQAPAADQVRHFCLHQPYEKDSPFLRVPNATHFYNETHKYLHHCTVMYTAGVRPLVSYREIIVNNETRKTIVTIPPPTSLALYASLATASLVFVFLTILGVRKFRTRIRHATPQPSQESEPFVEKPFRVVLLYCRDDGTVLDTIVTLLTQMLTSTGRVEVEDPYRGASLVSLLEDDTGKAKDLLGEDFARIILMDTRRAESVQATPRERLPFINIYDRFFLTALRLIEQNLSFADSNRIFRVTMDSDLNVRQRINLGQRVYLIPNNLDRLLNDVLGSPLEESDRNNLVARRLILNIEKYLQG